MMGEQKPYNKRNSDYWDNYGYMKEFEMTDINRELFELFRDERYPDWKTDKKHKDSWLQYKSRVGNFLEQLDKSFIEVKGEDIVAYLEKQSNARNHINGFTLFHIKNNTKGFRDTVDKSVLLYLLGA